MIRLQMNDIIRYDVGELQPGDKLIRFSFRDATSEQEYVKPEESRVTVIKYSDDMLRIHCSVDGGFVTDGPTTRNVLASQFGSIKQGIGYCLEKDRELFLLRYFAELQERILKEKRMLEDFNGELATVVYTLTEEVYKR